MDEIILHTFEAGRRGKPDEFDSIVANSIAKYIISLEPKARFDLRVNGGFDSDQGKLYVDLGGEVTSSVLETKDFEETVKQIVIDKYYDIYRLKLEEKDFTFQIRYTPQSAALESNSIVDIAGDSGAAIAVAYANTPNRLPWERYLAVGIRDMIDGIFQNNGHIPTEIAQNSGIDKLEGLYGDGKIEVIAEYKKSELVKLRKVVIATSHDKELGIEELREKIEKVVNSYLAKFEKTYHVDFGAPAIYTNGADAWNDFGGWRTDAGTREAKPYRDGFATYGVMDDSFSGEDPTKVSGTGCLLARNIAVSVVDRGLANFARVALNYQIGSDEVQLNVYTAGSAKISQPALEDKVRKTFDLRVSDAIKRFNLRTTDYYRGIIDASDYFQDSAFEWNNPVPIN